MITAIVSLGRTTRCALALLTLVILPGPTSMAQTTPNELDATLTALVADLDADDFRTRREAAVALQHHSCSQSTLYALLESDSLTLEQRHRIIAVAQERLVTTPRGALGISMRTQRPDPDGPIHIQVIDLLDGMPAREVLELGDRITTIDGTALTRQDDLRTLVQRHRPGDIVRLTILREKRRADGTLMLDGDGRQVFDDIEVNLTLGAVEDLNKFDNGDAFNNSMVLQERRREAGLLLELYAPVPTSVRFR